VALLSPESTALSAAEPSRVENSRLSPRSITFRPHANSVNAVTAAPTHAANRGVPVMPISECHGSHCPTRPPGAARVAFGMCLALRTAVLMRTNWIRCGALALLMGGCSSSHSSNSTGPVALTDGGAVTNAPRADGGGGPPATPIFLVDAGPGQGGRGDASAFCAAEVHEGESIQLDMLLLMDGSGSMTDLVQNGSKWSLLLSALRSFLNDPASTGLGIGLTYFGLPLGYDAGELIMSCDVADYVRPAVSIATLPQNAQAIMASLESYLPQGGTPTRPALKGAGDYAHGWLSSHPTHQMIVVLATDGQPNDCDSTVDAVSQLAADATQPPARIRTYVIGVGDNLLSLDQVANAGGTEHAYLVDTSGTTSQSFVLALNSIRRAAALPCQYGIPAPSAGSKLDFGHVNVAFSSRSDAGTGTGTGSRTILLQVPGKRSCSAAGEGWYYDDPSAPQTIELCSSTCTRVENDTAGRIEVLVGCETQTSTIR